MLEEFKTGGKVFRPPQISGRYMILNGAVFWIFHDRTQEFNQTSYVGFGRYTISSTEYAYRYDDLSTYTHTDAGLSISRKLPWEGMRSYVPVLEQDGMHLRNADAQQDFLCSTGELLYTSGSGDYRKYQRITSE